MITTRALTKDFVVSRSETVHAVRGVSIDIEPGELVAVLGPNGAGKTTLMRMLTTLIPPSAGAATVAGHDIATHPAQVRRRIGYVGQGNGAGHTQRVHDELATQGEIYGLDRRAARTRADELIEALDLTALRTRKVSELSGGQRRRLDVALGLVHAPPLLFLDEPSTGLDPQNRANLWEHIGRLRERHGMTVVLTTHYLDEADSMAERVVIVDHGEVIADDTAEALKTKLAGDRLTLTTPDAATVSRLAEALPGSRDIAFSGERLELRVADAPTAAAELLYAARDAGARVTAVAVHRPTLDDVFLTLTGRSLRETSEVSK